MTARLRHWVTVYLALLRARFGVSIIYRAQLVIWILSGVLPMIMMTVWLTIARDQPDGTVGGFDRVEFVSYYLAVLIVRRMTGVWIIWDIDEDIRQGHLSAKLLRPLHPSHNYLAMALTDKPIELALLVPPVAIAAWLSGAQYDFSPGNLLAALLSVVGAIAIEYGVSMIVGALGFWITQMLSVMEVWFYSRAFFSGWIIPLALFPETVQDVLFYLPYRYVLSFPIEIMLGQLTLQEMAAGFTVQWGWVALFFIVFNLLWRRGVRQYSAVGA